MVTTHLRVAENGHTVRQGSGLLWDPGLGRLRLQLLLLLSDDKQAPLLTVGGDRNRPDDLI